MIRDHVRSRDERELAEGEAGEGWNRLRFEGAAGPHESEPNSVRDRG
jgi:hypothetical protein